MKCPNCKKEFTQEMRIKFISGYNITCKHCNIYIYNDVLLN